MHQMIHTNERRKKCKICGLELRSNSHMSRHMRVHTGEKVWDMEYHLFSQAFEANSLIISSFYSNCSRLAVVYVDKNLLKGKLTSFSHYKYYLMNFTYEIQIKHFLLSLFPDTT